MKENRIFVILEIHSKEDMDFSEIVKTHNINYKRIWKIGDFRVKGSGITYKESGFSVEKIYYNEDYGENCIKDFFKDENTLKVLGIDKFRKFLRIIVYRYSNMPTLYYDTKLLSFLSKYNIDLDHDIYCLRGDDS